MAGAVGSDRRCVVVVDTCRFSLVVRVSSWFLLLGEVVCHSSFAFAKFLPLLGSVASFSSWFRHGRNDLLSVFIFNSFISLFVCRAQGSYSKVAVGK